MVKVQAVGTLRRVTNPQTGQQQDMIPVTFVELSKRAGGNADLSNSSQVLDQILGFETGLPQFRTHTQLVTPEGAKMLNVGRELPQLYINRRLTSFPNMVQQTNAAPRMIDGKPTYFSTTLDNKAIPDTDERLDSNVLGTISPELFRDARLGATIVEEIDAQGNSMGDNREFAALGSLVNQSPAAEPLESSEVRQQTS